MKNFVTIIFFILFINGYMFSQEHFQYISPINNANLVSLSTNIIAGTNEKIDASNLNPDLIKVTGAKSGVHNVTVKLSDDGKTIIFVPQTKFLPDEKVDVQIFQGIRTINGQSVLPFELTFNTTSLKKPISKASLSIVNEDINGESEKAETPLLNKAVVENQAKVNLPPDFPAITVESINNPSPGGIFISNFPVGTSKAGFYLTIVNNDGSIAEYKKLPNRAFDFKVQPNGELSYYTDSKWFVMDTSFNVVDTFQCGNGYTADLHDFELLPNGHALLFANDPEPVDMSQVTPGGNPNATVVGGIIQELDSKKNVIFQWRSWDNIPITDSYIDLTTKTVDYLHMNAVDFDYDGNILASNRHISTIIKIDRKTGEVMWRMGGKENEFDFINERDENYPNFFSFQHDIRRLPNGDVTLFDNGNQHVPNYSRAVEYKLDEINKTATLVWEYRHSPDIYGNAMGSVQRLPNGNTVIGWGRAGANGKATATEIHPDKSIAMELFYPKPLTSYRAYKFPWKSQIAEVSDTLFNVMKDSIYSFKYKDSTFASIKLNEAEGTNANLIFSLYNYSPVSPVFNGIAPIIKDEYFTINQENLTKFEGEIHIMLSQNPKIKNPEETIIYFKGNDSTQFVPLATNYDSLKGELVADISDFGKFIFGEPQNIDTVYSPVPITPQNGEVLNGEKSVKLHWGYRGITRRYHLQVSLDSLFHNPVINDSEITSNFFTIDTVVNDTSYYWKVSSINLSGESTWSDKSYFSTSSPFITAADPIQHDTLFIDSTYVIRWDDNISGPVKIELIKGDKVSAVISDSIYSATDAFVWTINQSVKIDSSYKIVITSLDYPDVSDTSSQNFIVNDISTGVINTKEVVKDYRLYQNYPNPFNPSTIIKYNLPKTSNVTISVFNIIGQRIAVLINRVQNSGEHEVVWNAQNAASGVYLYKIKAEDINGKNSFVQYRKAVLIK